VPCCDFIKPNYKEIKGLFPKKKIGEAIEFISQKTNVCLKEGHNVARKVNYID
jgi:hydroxymethylpyrimidine/phosphomethylpyrimidine kinase